MHLRALSLLLTITASFAAHSVQAATTGTLTFNGQINAGTCNLAAGDVSRTITLPTVKISDFDSSPSAGFHEFEVSADCESDIRNVIFLFAGTPSTGNAALFANTGTSGGIATRLESRAAPIGVIPANGTETERSRTIATSDKKAVLPMKVAYQKTGAAVTQGTLVSAVTLSITYN